MSIWAALLCLAVEMLLVAALAARPAGARVGFLLALFSLMVPALTRAGPLVIAVLASGFVFCTFRAWELVRARSGWGFRHRLVHLFAMADMRHARPVPSRLDLRAFAVFIIASAMFAASLWLAVAAEGFDGWRHYALRWPAGGFMAFTALEALAALMTGMFAALGLAVPVFHDSPYRSVTLAEFWGQRWNRIVSGLLDEHAFRPLRRRSPWLALTASFALSAAFHAYMIGVALGGIAALCWALFFLAQPPLIAAERRLKVRRWPVAAARSWTLGSLLLLSPLMTESALQMFIR